jgi:ribosomal protein S12 methylthiotransferase
MKRKKIGLVSLGCPKNLVDSEGMAGRLQRSGYTLTDREEEANLVLINTCGFIDTAKEESIDTILAYCKRKEGGHLQKVVVTGCLAERYREELEQEIPEVDRFLPISAEERIVEEIDRLLAGKADEAPLCAEPSPPRILLTPFYSAYLKISEGCSHRCSYCTIPSIRGPHRSRGTSELLEEAEALADQGVRELIVIGQDITRFGRDRHEPGALLPLLKRLVRISGLSWIRLMYLHPDHLFDELIDLVGSEEKIVSYLDLPLQHISDRVLRKMKRREGKERIRKQLRILRERIPDLVLRTSLIVGFPGEGEADFQALREFVEETRFHHLGVFEYSREEGTEAATFPEQVPPQVKAERREILMRLQAGISRERNAERIGSILKVLVEGRSEETDLLLAGRYYGQAPEIDGQVLINEGNAEVGEFYDVRITDAFEYDLFGGIIGGEESLAE